MVVDFDNITEYYANTSRLEEILIFWIAVAGKKAATIAPRIDKVLKELHTNAGIDDWGPFAAIRLTCLDKLSYTLNRYGIGCRTLKSSAMHAVAWSGLDLRACSREELLKIVGIGLKTASCFILHTRRNAVISGLDTHILKFLSAKGYFNIPVSTPANRKEYYRIERLFLNECLKSKKSAAQLDLGVWEAYSKKDANKIQELITL